MVRPMPLLRLLPLALCAALVPALDPVRPASAQDIRQEQVAFPAGTTGTRLTGRITGRESVSYLLGAEAGQTIDIKLTSANTSVYFNLYAPGKGPGDEALVIGELTEEPNRYSGTLPASGSYTISVFLYRNAARDGETADYALDISVTGTPGAVVQGDFADGLAGGPDFLGVATRDGGALNLRAEASAGAAVVTKLAQGTVVRNLGCRMAEGRRWCRVATLADPGFEGWAAGEFLVEAAAPTAGALSPEAACRAALAPMIEPGLALVVSGSEARGADTLVSMTVGPCAAPWQCLAHPDGTTEAPMFMGDDGAGACPAAERAAAGLDPTPPEQACLSAVATATGTPEVVLLASDASGSDTLVQVGVGPQLAPWQCIAAADGATRSIQFLGQDGDAVAAVPDPGSTTAAAEAACVAAVAAAANNASVMVLAAVPDAAGTRVALTVGSGHAPWTCTAGADGTTRNVAYTGNN